MDLELDESIALNYVSIDRYNGYMNAIAKMYKLDAWVERRVRTSGDVYAITFGPAWQADEQALKHKYVHIICKFVGDTKKGKITHFAVSTQKEAIQATASSFKLKSGIEFIEIPDKVKTIKQLWPLIVELATTGDVTSTRTNTRRLGTDLHQDQIDAAVSDLDRTQQFYKNAENRKGFTHVTNAGKIINIKAGTIEAEQFWLERVFNDEKSAINRVLSITKKEIDNKVGSWDEIIDAYSELDGAGVPDTSRAEAEINYDAPHMLKTSRTPEEIVMFEDYIKKLYELFEKKFQERSYKKDQRLKFAQMIITHMFMMRSIHNFLRYDLPYKKEVEQMHKEMARDGYDAEEISSFYKYFKVKYGVGEQRHTYQVTMEVLKEVVQELEGPGFEVHYVEDGDDTFVEFKWKNEAAGGVVPNAVLSKIATAIVKGKNVVKKKDLKYMLPISIYVSRKRKSVEYNKLVKMYGEPEKNALAFYTKKLLTDTSKKADKLIDRLVLKLVANESLVAAAIMSDFKSVNS